MKKVLRLSRKKKILLLVICSLIISSSIYGYNFYKKSKPANTSSLPVAQVTRGDIKISITGTGNIQPVQEQHLTPEFSAEVEEIHFKEGDRVKAGDLIYVLSNDDLAIEFEKARINLDNALLDYNTTTEKVSNLEVRSPINGTIERLQINEGDTVNKDQVIATIIDKSTIKIKAPLNSLQKQKVSPGQQAKVTFPSSFATYAGKVVSVDQTGTPQGDGSIFYYAHVVFENPGGFVEGEEGYVTISAGEGDISAVKPGKVEFNEYKELKSTASAVVEKILKSEKDVVSKGEVIAIMSSDELQLERTTKDVKVKQAQIEYRGLSEKVSSLKIFAEIDGILAGQNVNPGDEIAGKESDSTGSGNSSTSNISLGSIYSNQKQVMIPVDELDISKIKLGQKAEITVEALANEVFEGTVSKISEKANIQNGVSTYDVTVTIPNGETIKVGMTADVEILVDSKKNTLLVPVEAILERNGSSIVMVPAGTSEGKEGGPKPVRVRTGLKNERYVEIIEGLVEGDKVILSGLSTGTGQNSRMPMGGGFGMPGIGPGQRPGGR